ncbi:MAG: SixA phosphatase family protein [Alphaproteobacteria bacterium]
MKRLILMRHAKAMIGEAGQADRDRSLSPRGFRDAMAMGKVLLEHAPLPDRILCSSARRTRETLAALLPSLNTNLNATIADALYETTQATYTDVIEEFAGLANVVLVIGHNPTIHATAVRLVGDGADTMRRQLSAKYPTGSIAIIDFKGGEWTRVKPASGTLTAFIVPRDGGRADPG